jgi:4-diphosphocytidyl-2C-methyl-D-erythritol kinase
MFGLQLSKEEMIKIALEIGSDVPFFIKANQAMLPEEEKNWK